MCVCWANAGIGYDFVPNVLDRTLVDKWVKTNDKVPSVHHQSSCSTVLRCVQESLLMARRMIREEVRVCACCHSAAACVGRACSAAALAALLSGRLARSPRSALLPAHVLALATSARLSVYLQGLGKDKRVVVVLSDSVRNYMTKFLDLDWMVDRGFVEPEVKTPGSVEAWSVPEASARLHQCAGRLSTKTVADLRCAPPLTVLPSVTCEQAGYAAR